MNATAVGPDPSPRMRLAAVTGLVGLCLIFLLALRSPTALYLGLFLALIGTAIAADRCFRILLREPVFWLAVLLFVWVFVRGWIDLATADARGFDPDPDAIWHHARFTLFLPLLFGLWFAAWWRYRHALLLCMGIGALVYYGAHWERLEAGLPGGDSALRSAMGESGLFSATLFFVSSGLCVSAWFARTELGRLERLLLVSGGALMTLASLAILLISISRAAWLAVLGTLLILAVAAAWLIWNRAGTQVRRAAIWSAAAGLGVVALTIVGFWDLIAGRFARDAETVRELLSGGYSVGLGGSFADRFRMLLQAGVDIREYPMWGVGPASLRDMLHVIWDRPRGGSGNYHSTYLNLLVAMGIPWTILWLVAHVWAVWAAVKHLISRCEIALAVGVTGAALAHFGTLAFQTRLWSVQGSALYLALMTIVCGALLHRYAENSGSYVSDRTQG